MSKKKQTDDALPETIYVRREGEGDETYLAANPDPTVYAEIGSTARVGVYKLVGNAEIAADVAIKTEAV